MKIFKIIVGIDVAKDTLAVSTYDGKTHIVKEFLYNQKTMSKNQRHALSKQAHHSKDILNSYDRHIKFIIDEIK